MAFTVDQKTLCYEILGLFEGGTFDWFEYRIKEDTSIASGTPLTNQVSFTLAVARLETIFTDIENGSDGREARIIAITVKYEPISLEQLDIRTGGTNTAPGARFSTRGMRALHRKQLETHLGIHVEASNTGAGRNIRVGR